MSSRSRSCWVAAITLPLLAVSCADPADTARPKPATTSSTSVVTTTTSTVASCPTGLSTASDEVAGQTYTTEVYVPDSPASGRRPAVIDLHGLDSDGPAEAAQTGFRTLADTEGFVVAEPTGLMTLLGVVGWEIEAVEQPDRDDIAYIGALIDRLVADSCVDPDQVMVVGMSNGGFLAAEVACRLPDRVRAIVAVAGFHRPADCTAGPPVAELAIHGTADPVVPFEAGGASLLSMDPTTPEPLRTLLAGSIAENFAAAATSAGCSGSTEDLRPSPSVVRRTFGDCPAGADHELVIVEGGGHTWPGAPEMADAAMMGPTSTEFSATQLAWEFFAGLGGR